MSDAPSRAQPVGSATDWLRSGEYLPEFLRDFHDQKAFFKAVDEVAQRSVANGNLYIRDMSWSSAQVYTIDIFLWMAARCGYTLQRSRKRVEFRDLAEFVAQAKIRRDREMAAVLGLTPLSQAEPRDGSSQTPSNPSQGKADD